MSLQLHLVFLVLLAAVMHAAWNAIVKTSGDRFLTATCNLVTGTFLGVFLLPLVPVPSAEVWPYLIVSVAVHCAYYLFLIGAYRFGDLSHVYPVARGSAPLLVTVLAAVAAGEVPSVLGVAAITMMSLGVASLSFDRGSAREYRTGPVMLALATGFLIALYTVIDGLGIRAAGSPWTYIVWLTFLEGIPFLAWTALRRRKHVAPFLRREWKQALTGGLLSKFAYGLVLYALAQGAMAHVSALRETSVLFAALIGAAMLKEPFGIRRAAAAAVIASGVVLLQIQP